jgi:hypothetical protein
MRGRAKGENLTNVIGKNSYERLGRLRQRVYLMSHEQAAD